LSDQPSPTAYGRTIQRLRKQREWSQEELGRRANLGHQTISDIETGRRTNPKHATLQQIADALEVPIGRLYAEEPAMPRGAA
jgi:transcriptional regulator with XRE-family HTH domain